MATDYDLLVLGAGPGGYPAAIRGAQLGLKTACVEKELLGGVCLNWGCIPSKALIKTGELIHKIEHAGDFGLTVEGLSIDLPKVVARSRKISKRFQKGVGSLFKKYGVTHLKGHARLTAPGTVEITDADGETSTVSAKHIVIATGARARTFPGIEPDGERVLTYREAIVLDDKPARAVVLGAGAIGMEFAYFWNSVGVEVTVVEGQDQVLPLEDAEVAEVVARSFTKSGITLKTGTFVDHVARDGDTCTVHLKDGGTLEADVVLAALGIAPNTGDIGADAVGLKRDGRGFVEVDASYRTNVDGVFALGDVCNRGAALAHVAMRQAHVCVERIAGHHPPDLKDEDQPSATYCQPQVASVGLTEAQAQERGLDVDVGRFPFSANGRAQGAGSPDGFVKVLVDRKYGEIVGAHVVGADATELVAELTLAKASEATADVLLATTHPHPTFSEAVMEAVAVARGESVHY